MTVYPAEQAPNLELLTISGEKVNLADVAKDLDFTLVVFFRGVFCPICKMQLQDIEEHFEKLAESRMKVIAVSMDNQANSIQFAKDVATNMNRNDEKDIKTTIAYGFPEKQAREWGLYISEGREGTAEPALFSEPGLFVIKPDNSVFMAQTQSAPFTRPSTEQLIGGLNFAKEHSYPARGTLTAPAPALEQRN